MVQKQLNHYECMNKKKSVKNNIVFVLDNFAHYENIGSAFRLADAFNIDEVIIYTKTELNMAKVKKTSRSCENYVKFSVYDNLQDVFNKIKQYGYEPFNVELTSQSVALRDVDFTRFSGVALIMGNENFGVEQGILDVVKNSCHIEMYGNNSSMNVSTALAIAVYHISENLLKK